MRLLTNIRFLVHFLQTDLLKDLLLTDLNLQTVRSNEFPETNTTPSRTLPY